MRAWNRTKLLWSYLLHSERVPALPVEYIVETTAKCNLYCPMCPRETLPQPKEDMPDAVFEQLVRETRETGEHMMLIGLGEPFLDRQIFDRIAFCEQHGVSTLLSTNGTLLDDKTIDRILDSSLAHITLSFDGSTKDSYEYYRKGAKFEKVRDNFVRFCRRKHERGSSVQVVLQMVRMERNWNEAGEFERFWRKVPGVDLIRIKADETNVLQPEAGHPASDWKYPCHYLWRGPMYIKHNGDVYPCCQSYMLDGKPIGHIGTEPLSDIMNSVGMRELRRLHVAGRAKEIDMCSRCCTTIPHPVLVAGSLLLNGKWVRHLLPWVEKAVYFSKLPGRLLKPPTKILPAEEKPVLVQIETRR
ncbi:MAG: radical SAM/SPASM domain-containing protein [Bryobacteraceae bacterium]